MKSVTYVKLVRLKSSRFFSFLSFFFSLSLRVFTRRVCAYICIGQPPLSLTLLFILSLGWQQEGYIPGSVYILVFDI